MALILAYSVGMKYLSLLLCFLVSCNACQTEDVPAKQERIWLEYPIQMHLAPNLTECQRAGVFAGITYWETLLGQHLIVVSTVSSNDLSVNGIIPQGVAAVIDVATNRPDILDQVEWVAIKGKDTKYLHSAEMRVQGCSLRAFAHEIGHVLGLGHAQGADLLMTQEHYPDAWKVLDTELDAVLNH